MVDSGSSTDSDEKRDTVPELKDIKKDKGKKPIEVATGRMTTRSSSKLQLQLQAEVDLITRKAKGIVIGESKKSQTDTTAATTSKKGRRKKLVNVVRRSYSLRSGLSEMAVDLDNRKRKGKAEETAFEKEVRKRMKRETLNAALRRKRKETEAREEGGLEDDPEEVCKRIKKERNNDEDDADKDGATGGYATRSATRNMMIKSN